MQRSSGPRKTATLSESIHHQLNSYALAATAAGVGAMAFVQPAQAKIVYTPVNERAVGVHLDLNNDGIADFRFCFSNNTFHCSTSARRRPGYGDALVVKPLNASNAIRGEGFFAFALAAGKQVKGGEKYFPKNDYTMASTFCSGTCFYNGHWRDKHGRYLGLKFVIEGKIHYAWARLNVRWSTQKAVLTGYAYETIAGKGIIAGLTKDADDSSNEGFAPDASLINPIPDTPQHTPQLGSLATLAMGAPALSIWRRKEMLFDAQ
jgi:hypothetical protein